MSYMTASTRTLKALTLALGWALLSAGVATQAGVIESKTLDRPDQPVVLKGGLALFDSPSINNADVTQSPNRVFVWAYDGGTGWRQVVFQIDEINNTYPTSPPPDMGCGRQRGTNYYGINNNVAPNVWDPSTADDNIWDANDELVFMSSETGDRVSQDEWAPGASQATVRYEVAVTDPLDSSKKGWAYIFLHETLPTWRTDDYVSWTESSNTVTAANYTVAYNSTDSGAAYFLSLSVSPAGGGTGTSLVQRSKLKWYGGAGTKFTNDEGDFRTQFNMAATTSCPLAWSFPWFVKDGRVRVLRFYLWMPYHWFYANSGVGFRPDTHVRYYKNLWHEESYPVRHGGSYYTDYYEESINHSSGTSMIFYDSNGETCSIDGTAETLASMPLWTWYQASSSDGSYVKLFRDTAYLTADKYNIYTDSGTTRGQGGIHFTDPVEAQSSTNKNQYYYFFLPSNAPNQGETYDTQIDSPLANASTSQTYAVPPDFTGIVSAEDVNGACVDEGVRVTWAAVTDWRDGCSSSCTNRKFEVRRDGVLVQTVTDTAQTTWVDLTGNNNASYDYGVEACGQTGVCTALGNTLPGMDYYAFTPALSDTSTTAADHDGCTGDGIQVSWTAPSDWGDNGEGARAFDLYWSADSYATPIATSVTSPHIYDAPDGVSRQYRVRATNGCDRSTDYAASAAVTDEVASDPSAPADPTVTATDLDACSLSGIQIAWNGVTEWGDNGAGSRKYDLYWSADGYATPLVPSATSPVTVNPPNSNSFTYRVIATNGCNLTFTYTDATASDGQTAPNFAGVQSVTDTNLCAASLVTVAWPAVTGDGPSGWNDGGTGSGTRHFEIYRSAVLVGTAAELATSGTDQPPAVNTAYTFVVRAVNRQGCWTTGGASVPGTDSAAVAPTATPGATSATDADCSAGSGITVSWDAVTDWGDSGSGAANRRYRLFWSGNSFASPIASLTDGTLSYSHNPPDDIPYIYRMVARNGCSLSKTYVDSPAVIDRSSCAPTCTLLVDDDFDPTNHFSQTCNGGKILWTVTALVGSGGTSAWQCDLSGGGSKNATSSMEMTTAGTLPWTTDVKLRFWSSCALAVDDAGIVEVMPNDTGLWVKVDLLPYPSQNAQVPDSITLNCQTGGVGGVQPAFQGAFAGAYYEARLDDYLTALTTQIKIRFRAASGGTNNSSTWVIDDVQLGYGITDGVYFWSLNGDLAQGAVKDLAGLQAVLSWEDGGLYLTDSFRIYRSGNAADIRQDASSVLAHEEPDTNAASYTWTTADGAPPSGTCYFYKVYGFKQPCGESNQGEN